MSCLPIPDVPIPTLPVPLTIEATLPPFDFDPELCCKILPFPLGVPPIGLGATLLNPAVNVAIASAVKSIQDYIDKLPHDCPKELSRQ